MQSDAIYKTMLDARAMLDSTVEDPAGSASGERCIAFRVGEELYAVSLGAVREVIVPPEVVPVPGAGRDVLGVINLRGSVVTVVNARVLFGLHGRPDAPRARILIVDTASGCVGALVDAVEDIILVDPDELDPVSGSNRPETRLRGSLTLGGQIAFVVHGSALCTASPGEGD